jgi:hypothetical protein
MAGLTPPSLSTSCRRHVGDPATSCICGTLGKILTDNFYKRGFMPVFKYPWENNDRAYKLLQNGAITVYSKKEYLIEDVNWLKANNYDIFQFDAAVWKNGEDFIMEMVSKLNLTGCHAANFDALNDGLAEIESKNNGTVLLFEHFDKFVNKILPRVCFDILDILELKSRNLLLFGQRLIVLIQTNDQNFQVNSLGSRSTCLNERERIIDKIRDF